ncbi:MULTISPECIES: class II histone deacetylase [unclassified Nocardioides]|jgi:acetoin utilization deacetylase AcuC-like enzyme|uniref:class II histone deacetylase n=1 Tax=unclassified Nocardioides TaxID=2615069 RepID=UPI000702BC89|nr:MULTISPECIES: class II histone deacetylase [unclassified Nocardioides]KRC59715.1 acetoin utilization protein [Nocardioides sp. Root79]KRC68460.1 acetoin utilization protein [Nocardioides sp. Root240]
MTTGYVYNEVFGWHDTSTNAGLFPADHRLGIQPFQHFENAETKRRLHELVVVSGLIDRLTPVRPRKATDEEILLVHTPEHLAHVQNGSDQPKGGDSGDGLSPFGPGGIEIGRLAAGGVIALVEQVVDGAVDNGYALVRPPGHHAMPEQGMGFCMFGNLAIAAKAVRRSRGVERIAIVDWDVHHGNGTQAAFYDDPDTLTISIHQDRVFPPDTGHVHERGTGAGEGYALNIPLPPGTGHGGYLSAMDRVITPAIERFRPDLVLVASGFDANAADPLARQGLTSSAYRAMTERLLDVADRYAGGRLAMSHEGGYNPVYVPFCGLAVIEALAGVTEPLDDPYEPIFGGMGQLELQPHQTALLDEVVGLLDAIGSGDRA